MRFGEHRHCRYSKKEADLYRLSARFLPFSLNGAGQAPCGLFFKKTATVYGFMLTKGNIPAWSREFLRFTVRIKNRSADKPKARVLFW